MTKLNKIVQVMVIAGFTQISISAFATETSLSQSTTVSNETKVSHSTNTHSGESNIRAYNEASVKSSTKAEAENTSTKDSGEPVTDKNDTEKAIEEQSGEDQQEEDNTDEPSEEENSEGSEVDQSSDGKVNLNNVVKIEKVRTTLGEATIKISEVGSKLTSESSQNLSGQLSAGSQLVSNTMLNSVAMLSTNNSGATESAGKISDNTKAVPENDQDAPVMPTALDSSMSPDTATNVTSEIANTLAQNTAISAVTDTTAVIEQSIQTSVLDSITSNTQNSVSESLNGQISTLVSEQINSEIAAATASELVNTISTELDLGI